MSRARGSNAHDYKRASGLCTVTEGLDIPLVYNLPSNLNKKVDVHVTWSHCDSKSERSLSSGTIVFLHSAAAAYLPSDLIQSLYQSIAVAA